MTKKLMFGYATLADKDYLEALLGEVPKGLAASLQGYDLGLQRYENMPSLVQYVVDQNWESEEFKTYFARKTDNPKSKLQGIAWEIDEKQERILDDWEFQGMWFKKEEVEIIDDQGNTHPAIVYAINDGSGVKVPNRYRPLINPYPVNRNKMLKVARENNLTARTAKLMEHSVEFKEWSQKINGSDEK